MWAGRLPLATATLFTPLLSLLFFVALMRLSCTTIVSGVVICCCHPGKFRSSSVLHFVADGIIVAML
jgi:hypothetical protein